MMEDRHPAHVSDPVRVAGDADRARIAAMLARAFVDDPSMSFIFPDSTERAKRMPLLFGLLFDADALSGMRLMTEGGEAATLWRGPGHGETGLFVLLRQAWPLWRALGGAIGRALAVSQAIEAHMPTSPHWYLHIAGCDPAAQGKGHGGAAIRSGLARVAGSGLATYLETATERNLGLYRALGIEVIDTWDVPRGGPRFWSMLRT